MKDDWRIELHGGGVIEGGPGEVVVRIPTGEPLLAAPSQVKPVPAGEPVAWQLAKMLYNWSMLERRCIAPAKYPHTTPWDEIDNRTRYGWFDMALEWISKLGDAAPRENPR